MFEKGQRVFVDKKKLIDIYIKEYPDVSLQEALKIHEWFFTNVLSQTKCFVVVNDCDDAINTIVYPLWKDIPHEKPRPDGDFLIPRDALVFCKDITFVDVSLYI